MGWAARLNPRAQEHQRTRKLRELCRKLPRQAVLDALPQMRLSDQWTVRRILDEVQPPDPGPCLTH